MSLLLDSEANRRVVDGMRAIGIILVIFFHVVIGTVSLLADDGVGRFVASFPDVFNFAWQALGSEIIFLFSGFLLSYLLLRELIHNGNIDIGNFYVRRLSRIVPLYMVGLLLYWLIRGYGRTELDDLVMNLLFISKLFGFTTIIPIGWSLEVLVQSYLLLPFLVLLLMRSGHPVKLVIVALGAALAARYLQLYLHPESYRIPPYAFLHGTEPPRSQHELYYQLYFRGTPFLLGFLLAYLVIFKDRLLRLTLGNGWSIWLFAVTSTVLVIASGCLPIQDRYSPLYEYVSDGFWLWFWTLQRFVFAIGVCGLSLCAWYGRGWLVRALTWLLHLGLWKGISSHIYSIYLFHPIFLIPAAAIGFLTISKENIEPIRTVEILIIVAVAVVLSNLLGRVTTRFIEIPAQAKVRQKLENIRWCVQA